MQHGAFWGMLHSHVCAVDNTVLTTWKCWESDYKFFSAVKKPEKYKFLCDMALVNNILTDKSNNCTNKNSMELKKCYTYGFTVPGRKFRIIPIHIWSGDI